MPTPDQLARLDEFLTLIRYGHVRKVAPAWNKEFRHALTDGLVTVGWGGVLKLTDDGLATLSQTTER